MDNIDNIIVKKIKGEDVCTDLINKLHIAFPLEDENPAWNLNRTRKFISNNSNLLLIAYMKGYMAGYIYGHDLDRFDNRKEFFIYSVYTSKAYRREGIMSKIIEALMDYLRKNKFECAWVLTNKSNKPAMSFYANTGACIPFGDEVMFEYRLNNS